MLLNHTFCVPLKLFFFPVHFIVSVFIVLSCILLNIMRFIVSLIYFFFMILPSIKLFINLLYLFNNFYFTVINNHYLWGYLQFHMSEKFIIFVMYLCVFSKLSKLEQLEELNLSGNKLKTIPSTVSSCKRLHTLIAHSNHITVFPEILNLPEIKVRHLLAIFAWPVWVWLCSAFVSFCVLYVCSL